jgi:DNA replication protein DnaC
VKETWGGRSKRAEQEVLDRFSNVDLLVIDEIGVQFETKTEENILFEIINERHESMKATILISNLDYVGFKKIIGERLNDRLFEDWRILEFNWESYRKWKRRNEGEK